jgi:hypothetical protein
MPLSSVVELATVNRSVKGSNPLEAAKQRKLNDRCNKIVSYSEIPNNCLGILGNSI